MSKPLIMIVDDDATSRLTLTTFLEAEYETLEAESAEQCNDMLQEHTPDLFLLDVVMPGTNGFELCAELRRRDGVKSKPMLFVSSHETPEDVLQSYEVGGNGFVHKPANKEKLLARIKYHLDKQSELSVAQANAEEAMKVAMEAMTSSSELGRVIEFVKESHQEHTLQGVAKKLCDVTEAFGLHSCAMVYGTKPVYVNCEEDSLEAKLLSRTEGSRERVVSLGVRTVICSDCVSVLVKDMPIADESRYGRFKDNLVVLASICDGRLLSIQAQQSVTEQRQRMLSKVIRVTELQLKKLNDKLREHDEVSRSILTQMIADLESRLFHLGLDEDQEEELMRHAYKVTDQLENMREDSERVEEELGSVLEGLYEILHKDG